MDEIFNRELSEEDRLSRVKYYRSKINRGWSKLSFSDELGIDT